MEVSVNETPGRRTGLVVPPPPLAMAIMDPDSRSRGGGSSSTDGSVMSSPSPVPPTDNGEVVAAAAELKFEEERRRKGKMLAMDETQPCAEKDAPLQPPVEKLMGDAIRSLGTQPQADVLTSMKGIVFDDIPIVSDKLRDILRDLGAVNHACVYAKEMSLADREKDQNRLLMSCKDNNNKKKNNKRSDDDHDKAIRFARNFSVKELELVNQPEQRQKEEECGEGNKAEKKKKKRKQKEKGKGNSELAKPGLDVQAYDRNGEVYHVKCRFLSCNNGYRIIGTGWTSFLRKNNLLVEKPGDKKRRRGKKSSPKSEGSEGHSSSPSPEPNGGPTKQKIDNVRIEVWVFRSRKLQLGCTDQEQGALGMVLLHYREEDGADQHVGVGSPGADEPCASDHDMEPEGTDRQGAAMPEVGEGPDEMVMAEPDDGPEVALPVLVVDAAGPQGDVAAFMDMEGSTTTQIESEAAEGLLLLKDREVDMGQLLTLLRISAIS